jgi:hypothetical protein
VNTGASWLAPIEAESRVLATQTKLNLTVRAHGEPDAVRVARPVRRAGRRNPSLERRQGAPVRPLQCAAEAA